MVNRLSHWLLTLLAVTSLLLGGCFGQQSSPSASASPSPAATASATPSAPPSPAAASPQTFANLPQLAGKATVVLTVKGGPITIEIDGTDAPITAGNFVDLVQRKVYDSLVFHRVVREPQPFVVQGGDPQSKDPKVPTEYLGTGGFVDPATGRDRYIPLEIKPQGAPGPVYSKTLDSAGVGAKPVLTHKRGAVAMARSSFPDSASSQFYIALADLPFLDGSYAVFGYVTEGMDLVDKIQQGDRIETARVTKGIENLKNGGKA